MLGSDAEGLDMRGGESARYGFRRREGHLDGRGGLWNESDTRTWAYGWVLTLEERESGKSAGSWKV